MAYFCSNSAGWQINIFISQSFYLFLSFSVFFCCLFLSISVVLSISFHLILSISFYRNSSDCIWRNSTVLFHPIPSVSFYFLHLCLILSRFPACLHIFFSLHAFFAFATSFSPFVSCRAASSLFSDTEVVL